MTPEQRIVRGPKVVDRKQQRRVREAVRKVCHGKTADRNVKRGKAQK